MKMQEHDATTKIKGDFAELICKHHFELMGCDVKKVGIEELSPSFAKLTSTHKAVKSLKKRMQGMPDFLVVHPSHKYASFVEVKYRKNITTSNEYLQKFSQELHTQYANFINDDIPIYFYLLTNTKPYVHIMKAKILSGFEKTGGFYPAQIKNLDNLSFFRGTDVHASFNNIYTQIIEPTIDDILIQYK